MRPGTKKILSALSVFLIAWLSLQWLLPLFSPFLLGLILALASEPVVSFLQKRLHVPRSVSCGIGISMTFSLFAMLLLLLGAFVAKELQSLAGILPDLEAAAGSGIVRMQSWLLTLAARAPRGIRPVLQENVSSFFSDGTALLQQAGRYLLTLARNLLSHVPDSALSLGTAILSGYMISFRLPRFRRWLLRRIPKERLLTISATFRRVRTLFFGWLKAQLKLMGVTCIILFLGLTLLRIPYALLWSLGISLVDAFPVLGTGTVLLPWSLLCLLQGDAARAIGLAGIYVTITLLRSVLEPKFLGRHLGMDPLVTLIAIYVGYKLWGIGGMILAPLLTVIATQVIPDRRRDNKL